MAALDPHDVLKNFEDLHSKYNFKEIDYKNFVDTLGGKHPKVDTKNASIVLLTYDKICGWFDEDDDEYRLHSNVDYRKILTVIPKGECAGGGCPGCGLGKEKLDCIINFTKTQIEWHTLDRLAEDLSKGHRYRSLGDGEMIHLKSIEVLQRQATKEKEHSIPALQSSKSSQN